MGNFLTQAESDFWNILRKKLPESFGYQWGIPDTVKDVAVDTAKSLPAAGFNPGIAVGMTQLGKMARKGLNAYMDLPTPSYEDLSKAVQARVAMSGIGPRPEGTTPPPTSPGDLVPNAAAASPPPAVNPVGTQARATMASPVPSAPPAITPKTTGDYARDFAKKNPGTQVNLNGQSLSDPFALPGDKGPFKESTPAQLGSTAMSSEELMPVLRRAINEYGRSGKGLDTLRNAVGRPDMAGGVMTSTDPDTGKEKLLMASFNPQRVRESFVTKPYGPGESPEEKETFQKQLDWANKVLSNESWLSPSSSKDKALVNSILTNANQMAVTARGQDITARGQDIAAQSHKESLGPAWARENLNALEAPGRMALTAAHARKLLEPNVVQGFSGNEHITLERNPDTGKYEMITKGEGPRTNQEEGSLLKTQQNLIQEQYKSDLETLSGKNIMATPEEKQAAQGRINAVKAGIGGQRANKPTWELFSAAAKKAGSKLSETQLRQAFNERYGR